MQRLRVIPTIVLLGTFAVACSTAQGDAPIARSDVAVEVAATKRVLRQGGEAAADFGRDHLGHFLKMRSSDLQAHGLNRAAARALETRTTHTSYCLRYENPDLSSLHPWRVGTIASGQVDPSSADRCRS